MKLTYAKELSHTELEQLVLYQSNINSNCQVLR